MDEKLAQLLEYVKVNGRACPQPMRWNILWEMLPKRRRTGTGWEPAPPLILGAWGNTPTLRKHLRFLEHLDWAHSHGCIGEIDTYLRALPESEWFHFGD